VFSTLSALELPRSISHARSDDEWRTSTDAWHAMSDMCPRSLLLSPSLAFFFMPCFRYTSKSVMQGKLLYAISNCQSIDGDATHEGRANMMMAWEEDEE
jgi:hypothetical protein